LKKQDQSGWHEILWNINETSPTKYNWISYVYIAQIDYIEPPLSDEGTLTWISFDELLNVPTPKTDWYIYSIYLMEKFCF
jgi:8-oxo-dGTP diphosphatase